MTRPRAIELARGKWPELLQSFGLSSAALDGRNHPCPCTGDGEDRFRFTDRNGSGSYFCHCDDYARRGRAGGISLLMCAKGWSYEQACAEIEKVVGTVEATPPKPAREETSDRMRARMQAIAKTCKDPSDAVLNYLASRGLAAAPAIRQGRADYWDKVDGRWKRLGEFDVMVCSIRGPDDKPHALHVTYLADGRKADVPSSRKVMGMIPKGSAMRLFPAGDELGIAEGIETALAARALFDVPVWACYSAGVLEGFEPPSGVKVVWIFSDNDENATGQIAAFRCKQRLHGMGIEAHVVIPARAGEDWNDVLLERKEKAA